MKRSWLILVACVWLLTSTAEAAPWSLIDNFNGYSLGQTTTVTGGAWAAEFSATANSNIVANTQGNALQTKGGAAWRGAEASLTQWGATLATGSTATFFWQYKALQTAAGSFDVMMGLTPSTSNVDTSNAWQDFNVMPFVAGASGGPNMSAANSGGTSTTLVSPVTLDTWYNIWVVVDNDATAPTYDVYTSTGTDNGMLALSNAQWRNSPSPIAVGQSIDAIGFMAAGGAGSELLVDNIYWATGIETTNPVPEPAALLLIGLGAGGLFAVRHRKRAA